MRDENEFVSIACETLCILEHCDKSFVNRIPVKILNKLKSIESNFSTTNLIIYKDKRIEEQDISEDTKNFIALLYYNYVADAEERKDILNIWIKNEEVNTINLFEAKNDLNEAEKLEENVDDNTKIVVYKETLNNNINENIEKTSLIISKDEKWYMKLFNKIKKLFSKKQ